MRAFVCKGLVGILVVAAVGCIPSEPDEPTPPPGVTSQQDAPSAGEDLSAAPRVSTGAEFGDERSLRDIMLDRSKGEPAAVRIARMDERLGFVMEGSLGFSGTFTKSSEDDPTWRLSATFEFPTSGYRIGDTFLSALGRDITDPKEDLKGFDGMVIINIPVIPPGPDDKVLHAPHRVSLTKEIYAGNDVEFLPVLGNMLGSVPLPEKAAQAKDER